MSSRPILTISDGQIQGTTLRSVLGVDYLAFTGIPYAAKPIGDLRFKPPQPREPWMGVRDASKYRGMAMQNTTDTAEPVVIGSEDCLYCHVYTRSIGRDKPVMVYIHGGSFIEGSGDDSFYREDYLMTRDIVLVKMNYRLGPFGFLNLRTDEAPGNQGLRDLIFVLKWVQKNISVFGGDPYNVTIFGNSAGSIICHLFTLIPATKGLFQKAILQSGSVFVMKELMHCGNYLNGFLIAKRLGFQSEDPNEVLEFLRSQPAEKLVELESRILTMQDKALLYLQEYTIVYDGDYAKDPIVPKPIDELLKNDAEIPIIVGHCVDEALLFFQGKHKAEIYEYYNKFIDIAVANLFDWKCVKDKREIKTIVNTLKSHYLKGQPINTDTIWAVIRLVSDFFVIFQNRKIVDLRNEHARAPTYFYSFSYSGDEMTIYQYDKGPQPIKGVSHADELSYLFYLAYTKKGEYANAFPKEGTKDRVVMERLLTMWYNFAAKGDPTPGVDRYITTVWKPTTKDEVFILDIGEELKLKDDKNEESRKIYEKFHYLFISKE